MRSHPGDGVRRCAALQTDRKRAVCAVDHPCRFMSLTKVRPWGRPDAPAKPVRRARCLWRDHRGGRHQPAAFPVPGRDSHDAPWPFDQLKTKDGTGYPRPWIEARDGRADAPRRFLVRHTARPKPPMSAPRAAPDTPHPRLGGMALTLAPVRFCRGDRVGAELVQHGLSVPPIPVYPYTWDRMKPLDDG